MAAHHRGASRRSCSRRQALLAARRLAPSRRRSAAEHVADAVRCHGQLPPVVVRVALAVVEVPLEALLATPTGDLVGGGHAVLALPASALVAADLGRLGVLHRLPRRAAVEELRAAFHLLAISCRGDFVALPMALVPRCNLRARVQERAIPRAKDLLALASRLLAIAHLAAEHVREVLLAPAPRRASGILVVVVLGGHVALRHLGGRHGVVRGLVEVVLGALLHVRRRRGPALQARVQLQVVLGLGHEILRGRGRRGVQHALLAEDFGRHLVALNLTGGHALRGVSFLPAVFIPSVVPLQVHGCLPKLFRDGRAVLATGLDDRLRLAVVDDILRACGPHGPRRLQNLVGFLASPAPGARRPNSAVAGVLRALDVAGFGHVDLRRLLVVLPQGASELVVEFLLPARHVHRLRRWPLGVEDRGVHVHVLALAGIQVRSCCAHG
mmetsp:Transcript_143712/g.459896  ORF Transcript_143712/g.459896 Transcript_143712/m.459896 type:complete len:441 (+) Transcript_143712:530-1852(+)